MRGIKRISTPAISATIGCICPMLIVIGDPPAAISRVRLASGCQGDRPDSGGDVETAVSLDAERLQRDRVVGAADQRVGADPDADRGAGGGSGIASGQSAGPPIRPWRDNGAHQDAALGLADAHTELR